jgi:hypothetical protein
MFGDNNWIVDWFISEVRQNKASLVLSPMRDQPSMSNANEL